MFNESKWTDQEIMELGYMPNEVVVKFKKDKVDLQTSVGRKKAESFIEDNAESIGNTVFTKLENKRSNKLKDVESLNENNVNCEIRRRLP